jgi:hypothetical protein
VQKKVGRMGDIGRYMVRYCKISSILTLRRKLPVRALLVLPTTRCTGEVRPAHVVAVVPSTSPRSCAGTSCGRTWWNCQTRHPVRYPPKQVRASISNVEHVAGAGPHLSGSSAGSMSASSCPPCAAPRCGAHPGQHPCEAPRVRLR